LIKEKETAMVHFSGSAKISVRSNLAYHHILAGAFFARSLRRLEAKVKGVATDDEIAAHRAYAMGAIMSAAAFLEGQ
jgi:hypothetical protein